MGLWSCESVDLRASVLSICGFEGSCACLRVGVSLRAVCFCVIMSDCMFVDS